MIVFVDPKHGRGGGQVVLERLLKLALTNSEVALVMPEDGQQAIEIPDGVRRFISTRELLANTVSGVGIILVANANACFPDVALTARKLRSRGIAVRSVAIIHNYPTSIHKGTIARYFLSQLDVAIAVEPGLIRMRRDALTPGWLSVTEMPVGSTTVGNIQMTRKIKSYARPDRSKGMHLLPKIFTELETLGYTCEVALGEALDGQIDYERRLREQLKPWLVSGSRTSQWICPGDIFMVPSTGGEAACLSAQEAMSRGAAVVASRVGLMTYLSPVNRGIRTFPVGDTSKAVEAACSLLSLDSSAFSRECAESIKQIRSRAGLWYEQVTEILQNAEETL